MAKRKRPVRRARQPQRTTNWWLIIGVIVAVVVVGGLLVLAFQEPGSNAAELIDYCLENPGSCSIKGSEDAPVTIVEISDYACNHCRDFNLDTAGLIEDLYVTPGDVRWITLPYALRAETTPPAEAALCAAEQGRFDDYHHRLFEMQGVPGLFETAGLVQAAADLGLDQESFSACVEEGTNTGTVRSNIRAANSVGVNSTPSFVVNDRLFRGNRPLTFFQQQIAEISGKTDAN